MQAKVVGPSYEANKPSEKGLQLVSQYLAKHFLKSEGEREQGEQEQENKMVTTKKSPLREGPNKQSYLNLHNKPSHFVSFSEMYAVPFISTIFRGESKTVT